MVTIPRIIGAFVFTLVLMTAMFAWRYSDLLYLRQPVEAIETHGREQFVAQATQAMARTGLTRRHLDTIADAAFKFGDPKLEGEALERRLQQDPQDVQLQLRLADVLRRTGNFERAETLFRSALAAIAGDTK
jgi:thioredoxin-like negative regulator of GroEL